MVGFLDPVGSVAAHVRHPVTVPETAPPSQTPQRLVFRFPQTSLLVVLFALLMGIPFISGLPWLWLTYLLPLFAGYVILRLRTSADSAKLVARGLFSTKTVSWDEVRSLHVSESRWLRAVTESGEVLLPTVRARHIPALALISGGRLSDPVPD
jgi:ABC-type amino acid transport system permease subunit